MRILTRPQLEERLAVLQAAIHESPSTHGQASLEIMAAQILDDVSDAERPYATERVRSLLAEAIAFYSDDADLIG